jgi:hypothetical protein
LALQKDLTPAIKEYEEMFGIRATEVIDYGNVLR